MQTLIDVLLAAPLLDVAATDAQTETRITAVDALTRLPLSSDAWRALAERGALLLRDLEQQSATGPQAFDVLARIPVRSMRRDLQAIADNTERLDGVACAMALINQRDPGGLPRTLRAFSEEPSEPIAASIACFPVENFSVDLDPFTRALDAEDPMVRFWAALALARLGKPEPLRGIWRTLEDDPPPLFYGNPWTSYDTLSHARPLPAKLRENLIATYKRAVARARKAEGAYARLPRGKYLLVGGLTGLLTPEGHLASTASASESAAASTEAVDPGAGRELFAELRTIGKRYVEHGAHYEEANNDALYAATRFGKGIELPVREMILDPYVSKLPESALTWTIARAEPAEILKSVGPLVAEATESERPKLVELTREIAASINAKPPFKGAGSGSESGPVIPAIELIDDVSDSGRTVYPGVHVSDAQPIAGAPVTIDVLISTTPEAETSGTITLPPSPPGDVHTLAVHLFFGGVSLWDTVDFSPAVGTTKKATFVVNAPATGADRSPEDIRVDFYLNHRWCGQGLRRVVVRRDESVARADPGDKRLGPPPPPDLRAIINLEPDANPADLTVRILSTGKPGEYEWSCLSPHMMFPAPKDPRDALMTLGGDAEKFVQALFKPQAGKEGLSKADIMDIEGAGEIIYRATPKVFKDAYWQVWRAAQGRFTFESIQIITDEPLVPWELMRLADDQRARDVDAEFLAIRHSVGRWLASSSSRLTQRIPVSSIAVSASDYANIASVNRLPWAIEERAFLITDYGAQNVTLTSDAVVNFLLHGCAQAVHFACHGRMSVAQPLTSQLILEDVPETLRPNMVDHEKVRRGLGLQHPLVFLNACDVGGAATTLSLVAGFPAAFLGAGSSAVIAPLWVVSDQRARQISEQFYKSAFSGTQTLGRILRDVRKEWVNSRHLTFLAYVLYGDPMSEVRYTGQKPPAHS